ncbi:MAG TPA: hypothetical protein PKW63_04495 [Vicinamibacterales bacterium]|nr:hypothetical protein [Vicinamibacterales bacterium]
MRQWIVTSMAALCLCAGAAAQSTRWYDEYDRALKAIAAKPADWATAETALLAARTRGPAQGPRVGFPGEIYKPFIPDYYLGVVYLNTGRAADAESTFLRVRAANIIDQKDSLYRTFVDQSRMATYTRAASDARRLIAAKDFTGAEKAIAEASDSRANDAGAKDLREELDVAMKPPVLPSGGGTPMNAPISTANQPVGLGDRPPGPVTAPPAGGSSPPPNTKTSSNTAANSTARPTGTPPANTKGARISGNAASSTGMTDPDQLLAIGLRAFLSGNYQAAADSLRAADDDPYGPTRAKLYLACANAALVLTGGADVALMETAKAQYNAADPRANLRAEDRRVISPRLLDYLTGKLALPSGK